MPSGKNHDKITWLCLPFILATLLILTQRLDLTFLGSVGFIFSGLMFGPDLDIYSIQYQRWRFLKFIWLPYQKTIKHRSVFSHGFIIGTVIRICYLSAIILIFSLVILSFLQLYSSGKIYWHTSIGNSYSIVKNQYGQQLLSLFIGLELGAMSHYVADNISSRRKYHQKKLDKSKSSISPRQKTTKKNLKKINNKRRYKK